MCTTSAISELLVATVKLSALQIRIGMIAAEVAALGVGKMFAPADAGERQRPSDDKVGAATFALKAKLLGRREIGFRNVLQINFPDDEIRAMAEAVLTAAHAARD